MKAIDHHAHRGVIISKVKKNRRFATQWPCYKWDAIDCCQFLLIQLYWIGKICGGQLKLSYTGRLLLLAPTGVKVKTWFFFQHLLSLIKKHYFVYFIAQLSNKKINHLFSNPLPMILKCRWFIRNSLKYSSLLVLITCSTSSISISTLDPFPRFPNSACPNCSHHTNLTVHCIPKSQTMST